MTAMQDAGASQAVSSPENYAAYLEAQGSNPMYSCGNILLAMVQNPNITQIGTVDRWKNLGRTVLAAEKNNGIQIFTRGGFNKGYTVSNAYDYAQTVGRELAPPRQLRDGSKEMETALAAVMNYSLVPIVVDSELPQAVYYDSQSLELAVNPDFPDAEVFAGLAAGIAHSRFHNKGKNVHYDYTESDLDAQSVAYLLCKRFGVKCEMPDATQVADLYQGWSSTEVRNALNNIQEMSKQIGGSIEKSITPQQHNRGNVRRPAK